MGCSTVALSSDAPDSEKLRNATPREIRELSEHIPSESPCECIGCSREWDNGTEYVETALRELREEWEAIQAGERETEQHLRYSLFNIAKSAKTLISHDPFILATYCAQCRLEISQNRN